MRKRLITILTATIMSISSMTTAFAADSQLEISNPKKEAKCYNLNVTSDGITSCKDEFGNEIAPRSSISGYDRFTATQNNTGIQVLVDSEGFGGMGVTIDASSSWNGTMKVSALYSTGSFAFQNKSASSNGETYYNNLLHFSPSWILFKFEGIPAGKSVDIQIWVYG